MRRQVRLVILANFTLNINKVTIKTMVTKHEEVQEYYGKTLESGEDLKTNACCTIVAPPKHITAIMSQIADEVMAKYYGCGLTIP